MEIPSDHWEGFASLDLDPDRSRQIQHLMSTADFDYLKTRATESRRRLQPDLPPHVECSVNLTHFACGWNNIVLELAFSDNVYWIARIPYEALDES